MKNWYKKIIIFVIIIITVFFLWYDNSLIHYFLEEQKKITFLIDEFFTSKGLNLILTEYSSSFKG